VTSAMPCIHIYISPTASARLPSTPSSNMPIVQNELMELLAI
jgi:hypothetical protein